MSSRTNGAVMLAASIGLFGMACQERPQGTAGTAGTADTADSAPGDRDAAPASASPVSERDRQRGEAFAAAINGLDFDAADGLVAVTPLGAADPKGAAEHLATAEQFMTRNRYTDAIAEYAIAIRTDPGNPVTYESLGMALVYAKKSALAVTALRSAVALDPESIDLRYSFGHVLSLADRKGEAMEVMEAIVEDDPAHGEAHERLAVWFYYDGEYEHAWEHVHAAQAAGHAMPPQFMALLQRVMPDPAG